MLLKIDKKEFTLLFVFLLGFGFLIKMVNINNYFGYLFDERFQSYTAAQILKGNPHVYSPEATDPKSSLISWNHPQLGRILIASFIYVFGNNQFGRRVGSAIFGTLLIFLAVILARMLFNSYPIALLTGFFLTFETSLFLLSRVGMTQIYFGVFQLLIFIIYWKWKNQPEKTSLLFFLGCVIGLAFAVKWTAIFTVFAIGLDLLVSIVKGTRISWKNILWGTGVLFVMAPIMYILSYGQMFSLGFDWNDFLSLQKAMLHYHTNIHDIHRDSSTPIEWIFNLKPVWFYVENLSNGKVKIIGLLGNTFIFWGGIIGVFLWGWRLRKKWSAPMGFVLIAYVCSWIGWSFSPRYHFLYHYAPALPLLSIVLAHTLIYLNGRFDWGRIFSCIVCFLVGLWFLIYYPYCTGIPMSSNFVNNVYYALPFWRF